MAGKPVKSLDSPLKLMIRDIRRIQSSNTKDFPWQISLPNDRVEQTVVKFSQMWLQGHIKSVDSGLDNITVSDATGEVQVTRLARVPGADRSWIHPGVYCGLMAAVGHPGASVVTAVKLMDISNKSLAEEMWPLEVEELANLLMGKISPNLLSS